MGWAARYNKTQVKAPSEAAQVLDRFRPPLIPLAQIDTAPTERRVVAALGGTASLLAMLAASAVVLERPRDLRPPPDLREALRAVKTFEEPTRPKRKKRRR